MTEVPFLDLRAAHAPLRAELAAAMERVLDSGRYVLGAEVEGFEREFAAYCGARFCVGVNSGLDAIRLALEAGGVGPGDEVVVPAHTFVATWLAVSQIGASPVPVPVDATFNLDPARVAPHLSERTKAIVPVHLYGHPADMAALRELAAAHGLLLIEDAAQAHGARDADGRTAGALGDAAAFSFYPGKNLGALGDGGAVVTDDAAIAERVRSLRNYGSARKYHHDEAGVNSRLDEVQAALLRVKLARLDDWNARRREIADRYLHGLAGTGVGLPVVRPGAVPAWHLFVVRGERRDELREGLAGRGVETLIHYPVAPHRSGAYADGSFTAGQVAEAERLADEVLSLPIGPHLDDGQVERVIEALRGVC